MGVRMGVRMFESGMLLFLVMVMLRVIVVLVMMMDVLRFMAVPAAGFVSMPAVRGTLVDVEFHPLDVFPLRAVTVHVEIAEIQLAQFPFEGAGQDAEIDERADHHVAADSGNAVEVKCFHVFCADWRPAAGRQSATNSGSVTFLS